MHASQLDTYLPHYDATDRQELATSHNCAVLSAALHHYDVGRHTVGMRGALRLTRALSPPADGTRLAELHELDAVALESDQSALLLGFIGPIWRLNAPLVLPSAATFRAQANASVDAAKVVWLMQATPTRAGSALSLTMRLQYPKGGAARQSCQLYWRLARLPSVWVRHYLLRCIAHQASLLQAEAS